ncbi:helix-turn-helix domain-containing protein [Streptomyces sp. NBC_01216]|uniref:helix-turn-helix domain-containing protein n=1 Tax=Streptomyces sp. NBC_01216 TaxID=2903778 RepID=UPI002E0ED37B|nr:helix-turn-helix domain-containing protein [Streptomyces sp. NBC_01216]
MSRRAADPATPLPSPKERRRLREARALSEEQIAEAMGVTRATVRSWETGRTDPRGRKREAYAKLLGAHEEAHASASTGGASGGLGAHARDEAREEAHPPGARAFDTAPGTSPAPGQEATGAEPAPEPSARHAPAGPQPSTGPTANTRPRTAAKRAARPPENPAPGPTPLHTPQERLKPGGSGTGPRSTAHPTDTPAGAAPQRAAEGERGEETAVEPSLTPEGAFDALYAHAAPGLVHQTYLLTGRRGLSRESVEHAFLLAWQRWPEVAVDRDPVGWVRAAAYEYALSPWHRLRRAHRHPDGAPTDAARRALLAALLELPPPYRRTVLLYDGLGLDLPETAAETEASTPAAANRLLHARTVIGGHVPELARPEELQRLLGRMVAEAPAATLAEPAEVRTHGERRGRTWTRTALGVTAALIAMTAFTAATAPTQYLPVNAPGRTVEGVPVRNGSQKLTPEDEELRVQLRKLPHNGPERLVPDPR